MRKLSRFLPAFSADYTGASSVLYGMDGILVGHDPVSCSTHAFITDEPREEYIHKPFFSSCINEIEAVTGNDEKHLKKIIQALNYFDARFITIIGTPVSAVIGSDFNGLAKIVEKRTSVPTIGLETTGFECYDEGIVKAYKKLADKFTGKLYFESKPCEVNVFGTVVADMWDMDSVVYLEKIIREAGAKTVTCWGADAELEQITGADRSKLNIAVSISGLEMAKYMKMKYGTPYIVGCPVGKRAISKFQKQIAEKLGIDKGFLEGDYDVNIETTVRKVLIIGEQMISNGIRNCLKIEFGIDQIDCLTFFRQDKAFAEQNDRVIKEEEDLEEYMDVNGPYDMIMGDLRLKNIVGSYTDNFVEVPHIVLSGRNRLEESFQILGEYGTRFFEHVLSEVNFDI